MELLQTASPYRRVSAPDRLVPVQSVLDRFNYRLSFSQRAWGQTHGMALGLTESWYAIDSMRHGEQIHDVMYCLIGRCNRRGLQVQFGLQSGLNNYPTYVIADRDSTLYVWYRLLSVTVYYRDDGSINHRVSTDSRVDPIRDVHTYSQRVLAGECVTDRMRRFINQFYPGRPV